MSKSKGKQTQTTAPDQETQDWTKKVYGAATAAGAGGPGSDAARQFYANGMKTGNLGMSALSGDPNAVAALMNPYQAQVMDRMRAGFGDINAATSQHVNDEATQAHAFGGSRHGVAEGVALAQNGKTQADQEASLLYGGYNDAMGRAGTMANFGMGAAGAAPQMDPEMMKYMIMKHAQQGTPYGTTQTGTSTDGHNPAAGALGGAISGGTLGSKFGPWGTGIGAGIGGLLGMFG